MTVVAIIAPGAMGGAIARRLSQNGVEVLTTLEGRSAASRARAETAGMRDVAFAELIARSDVFLSVVPPASARAVAENFAAHIGRSGKSPLYVDGNAIAVAEVERIAALIEAAGGRCVDACLIGAPPKDSGPGPTLYVCGPHAPELLSIGLTGLTARLTEGPIGAATALKLSYAGITKGLTAIAAAMILAAERAGAGEGLRAELLASQPQLLARFATSIPDMFPKAYRWVEEMRAIAEFIGAQRPESQVYDGAAGLFQRLAGDDAQAERESLADFLARR